MKQNLIGDIVIHPSIEEESGGKLSFGDLGNLLSGSYDKKNKPIKDWDLDTEISGDKSKVYRNKDTNQVVVSHRGTSGFTDWFNNLVYGIGGEKLYKKTSRYKDAEKVQKLAEQKYDKNKISTVGHSQGGLQAKILGKDTHEIITLNRASRPFEDKNTDKQYDIKLKHDIVSKSASSHKNDIIMPSSYNPISAHTISGDFKNIPSENTVGGKIKKEQNTSGKAFNFSKAKKFKVDGVMDDDPIPFGNKVLLPQSYTITGKIANSIDELDDDEEEQQDEEDFGPPRYGSDSDNDEIPRPVGRPRLNEIAFDLSNRPVGRPRKQQQLSLEYPRPVGRPRTSRPISKRSRTRQLLLEYPRQENINRVLENQIQQSFKIPGIPETTENRLRNRNTQKISRRQLLLKNVPEQEEKKELKKEDVKEKDEDTISQTPKQDMYDFIDKKLKEYYEERGRPHFQISIINDIQKAVRKYEKENNTILKQRGISLDGSLTKPDYLWYEKKEEKKQEVKKKEEKKQEVLPVVEQNQVEYQFKEEDDPEEYATQTAAQKKDASNYTKFIKGQIEYLTSEESLDENQKKDLLRYKKQLKDLNIKESKKSNKPVKLERPKATARAQQEEPAEPQPPKATAQAQKATPEVEPKVKAKAKKMTKKEIKELEQTKEREQKEINTKYSKTTRIFKMGREKSELTPREKKLLEKYPINAITFYIPLPKIQNIDTMDQWQYEALKEVQNNREIENVKKEYLKLERQDTTDEISDEKDKLQDLINIYRKNFKNEIDDILKLFQENQPEFIQHKEENPEYYRGMGLRNTMNLLEIFKGTGSVGKVAKKMGYSVISIDFDPIYTPTIETDILKWNYKKMYKETKYIPDFIWASPPCNTYSPLAYPLKERNPKTAEPYSERAKNGTDILYKTLQIINFFKKLNPNLKFCIENPRGMMRNDPKMKKLYMETTKYCLYGDIKEKATNFWSNFNMDLSQEKKCKNKTIPVVDLPLNKRYSIPSQLIKQILLKSKNK